MNPFRENRFFRFLGSVRMAVPTILLLAVLLAAGTIVESRFSTYVAKRFVYGTWWFGLFLSMLAVNLFCSAFSRFPWKKHQTGFVVTHLGIILILAGSLVTQKWGTDGQIVLTEGEGRNVYQEDKPVLYYQTADGIPGEIPASFSFRAPSPDRPLMLDLPGGGLLMVDQFLLNAAKKVRGRIPEAGEKGLPGIHLSLNSSFVSEDQWLFLGDKDKDHLDLGPASAHFERENTWKNRVAQGSEGIGANALAILQGKDGKLYYQVRHRGSFGPREPLETGRDYSTGWMDMKFKVGESLPSAVAEEIYESQPLPYQKDPEPAIHYSVVDHPDRKEGWLGFPSETSFPLKGKTFSLAYAPHRGSLPFRLQLTKFHIGFDPGTEKPSSYASDVFYTDSRNGTQTPAVISMNEPLHLKGYTVYQASYQALPDGKYISVFSVGKDPGIWLKYGGAIVMVLGLAFMFWFKNPAWNKRGEIAT